MNPQAATLVFMAQTIPPTSHPLWTGWYAKDMHVVEDQAVWKAVNMWMLDWHSQSFNSKELTHSACSEDCKRIFTSQKNKSTLNLHLCPSVAYPQRWHRNVQTSDIRSKSSPDFTSSSIQKFSVRLDTENCLTVGTALALGRYHLIMSLILLCIHSKTCFESRKSLN